MKDYHYIPSTQSTNTLLKELLKTETLSEFFSVRTAFQTAGKGQTGNSWESERGKNLLFSMVLYPHHIAINNQFVISQIVSLGILNALKKYVDNIEIKWPNDIYYGNKKLGGILIENSLRGARIEYSIVGIGLNINQQLFKSNAPNPVSLIQLTGKKVNVKDLFSEIVSNICSSYTLADITNLKTEYFNCLYRKKGFYLYKNNLNEVFEAKLVKVESDGQLLLEDKEGKQSGYYFKEIEFIL